MPLSWVSAFKRALVYFVWLIVWGIIGGVMIAIGYVLALTPLMKAISDLIGGRPPTWESGTFTGIALALVGYVIIVLGTTATFIRLIYQLSYEATQEVVTKGKAPAVTPPVAAPPAAQAQPAPRPAAQPLQPTVQPPIPPQPVAPTPTPPQLKYCAFCGKSIPMVARFCPFCQRAQP